jgi:hypothetical protein
MLLKKLQKIVKQSEYFFLDCFTSFAFSFSLAEKMTGLVEIHIFDN